MHAQHAVPGALVVVVLSPTLAARAEAQPLGGASETREVEDGSRCRSLHKNTTRPRA